MTCNTRSTSRINSRNDIQTSPKAVTKDSTKDATKSTSQKNKAHTISPDWIRNQIPYPNRILANTVQGWIPINPPELDIRFSRQYSRWTPDETVYLLEMFGQEIHMDIISARLARAPAECKKIKEEQTRPAAAAAAALK